MTTLNVRFGGASSDLQIRRLRNRRLHKVSRQAKLDIHLNAQRGRNRGQLSDRWIAVAGLDQRDVGS